MNNGVPMAVDQNMFHTTKKTQIRDLPVTTDCVTFGHCPLFHFDVSTYVLAIME